MSLLRRDFLRQASGGLAALALSPELDALFPVFRRAEKVRIGVIGTGKQGNRALEELATMEAAQVVAIADVDPGRRKRGLRRAPSATLHESGVALLAAGGLDAVVIATPTHLHKDLCVQALAMGLPVYLEAPLAHDPAAAQAIAEASAWPNAFLTCGYYADTNPVYKRAKDVFRSGALRDLVSLRGHWRRKTSWREAAPTAEREKALNWKLDPQLCGGLPSEIASHQIHTLRWFTGFEPELVRGWGSTQLWQDGRTTPDTVQLHFGWPKNVLMQQELTLASSIGGTGIELSGTHGTIRLAGRHAWLFKESDSATQGWEVYAHRARFHQDEGYVLLADATKLAAQGKLQEGAGLPFTELYYALQAFVAAVQEKGPPACPASSALPATLAGIHASTATASGLEVLLS